MCKWPKWNCPNRIDVNVTFRDGVLPLCAFHAFVLSNILARKSRVTSFYLRKTLKAIDEK
jgi:hypothetical protein